MQVVHLPLPHLVVVAVAQALPHHQAVANLPALVLVSSQLVVAVLVALLAAAVPQAQVPAQVLHHLPVLQALPALAQSHLAQVVASEVVHLHLQVPLHLLHQAPAVHLVQAQAHLANLQAAVPVVVVVVAVAVLVLALPLHPAQAVLLCQVQVL